MFKVMKENQNYFNSPLLIFKQKNIISSNVPTGFKSNSIILDFMASVISLTYWSLVLLSRCIELAEHMVSCFAAHRSPKTKEHGLPQAVSF